jgi:iron-sulfur cluster assembly protein
MVAGTETRLPEGVRIGNEDLVRLTPPAGAKAAALIEREKQGVFLRVAISGGGCNGLAYKLRFVENGTKVRVYKSTGEAVDG